MSEKEALLISACLLGVECKYSGGHNAMAAEKIAALREKYRLIPVCPETAGGLPTPRDPSERRGGAVVSCKGRNVTAEYSKGADAAVSLAERNGCKMALLKEKSPSCGSGVIYDLYRTADRRRRPRRRAAESPRRESPRRIRS